MPFDLFNEIIVSHSVNPLQDGGEESSRYTKLMKLPRVYRIIRIFKVLKLLKVFRYGRGMMAFFKKFNFNASNRRLFNGFAFSLFFVHLMACAWYMQARMYDFSPTTWVYQKGLVDTGQIKKYCYSLYWAFQTITTVGYGDFGANNFIEYFINIFMMIVGGVSYSLLTATLTSNFSVASSH
jgi:hypothetical protein